MEKLLMNPYDKEYMKMAMLKHEETFREQLYELHRLYQIQKILMKDMMMTSAKSEGGRWNLAKNASTSNHQTVHDLSRQCLDLEQPSTVLQATKYNITAEEGGDAVVETEDDVGELELTLGPSSFHRRRSKAVAEMPLPSDSGPSFSSSSTGSSHIRRTSSGSHQITSVIATDQKWPGFQMQPVSNPSFLSGRKNSVDVEEQLRQDRLNNSPWLFQVLSLNMT